MAVDLFSYQKEGSKWLTQGKVRLLADEMGLGKSAQAIAACDALDAQRILVLCPAVARINWIREFSKFSSRNLTCGALLTTKDSTKPLPAVTVCSYDLATSSAVCSRLSSVAWNVIVLDEAHYLKNAKAKRTQAVLGRLAPKTERLWALTGTPAPNNPAELYPLLRVFGVWRDSYWPFVERFCTSYDNGFGIQITGGRNLDELRALMAPVILRRKKDEVMKDLPPLMFSDVIVEPTKLSDDALMMYFSNYLSWPPERRVRQFQDDMAKQNTILTTLSEGIGIGADDGMKVLEGLDKQVTTLRRYIGLQKVPAVVKLVSEELESGAYEKIVLFAVHKDVIETLREGLRNFGAVTLWGGTPAVKRDRIIQKFQLDPKCRVFIGQIVAAGTAITLTAAHQVGVVEADWTPANNQQAVMRCHRIGQSKPVSVRFFGLAGSIDERIQQVLKRKTKTLVQLFDHTGEKYDPFAD